MDVPEASFQPTLIQLAAMVLVVLPGVSLNRVVRRVRAVRDEQYGSLRGLFHSTGDDAETMESAHPRFHVVTLGGDTRKLSAGPTWRNLGSISACR